MKLKKTKPIDIAMSARMSVFGKCDGIYVEVCLGFFQYTSTLFIITNHISVIKNEIG